MIMSKELFRFKDLRQKLKIFYCKDKKIISIDY